MITPASRPKGRNTRRSAGLQTGIAPRSGAKLPSLFPAWHCAQQGWRDANPGDGVPSSRWVRAMGEHGGGSFAACGRDAGQFSRWGPEDRRS